MNLFELRFFEPINGHQELLFQCKWCVQEFPQQLRLNLISSNYFLAGLGICHYSLSLPVTSSLAPRIIVVNWDRSPLILVLLNQIIHMPSF